MKLYLVNVENSIVFVCIFIGSIRSGRWSALRFIFVILFVDGSRTDTFVHFRKALLQDIHGNALILSKFVDQPNSTEKKKVKTKHHSLSHSNYWRILYKFIWDN